MKITIIGTAYPFRGGLAAFNERLALEFANECHYVNIETFTLQYPSFLFPGKTQYSSDAAPERLSIRQSINSINPFNWRSVGKRIAKDKPDLVIFAYWMAFMAPCFGTITRIIKKNKKTKCIGLIHNMIPHEPSLLDKLFPSYFVKQMDGFVTLSKSVIDDINRFDKRNTPKICSPHPIYDHYGSKITKSEAIKLLNLDPSVHYILFFGFIRGYKGLDLLLNAIGNTTFKELNVKLIVAGEFYGDAKPYLKQIENLHIEDCVILHTDFIPNNEVGRYFCAADIVVQPYKTATQSGVTQIAYHFERPMMVTNVGGLAEIVPHNKVGLVVEPNAQAIAEALISFFKEKKEIEFESNITEEKKKYAWNKMVQAILHIYNQI